MQLTTLFAFALAAAGTSLAAPAPAGETVSMAAAVPDWTIEDFKRVCNAADTSCTYTYIVDTHINNNNQFGNCNYKVTGSPASRTAVNNVKCGAFTVSSGWSGQFGEQNGFTTLAIKLGNKIAYPSYTDKELKAGKVVRPNRSYPVQKIQL